MTKISKLKVKRAGMSQEQSPKANSAFPPTKAADNCQVLINKQKLNIMFRSTKFNLLGS